MKPDFKENLLENTLTINEKAEFETLEDTIKREMGSFIAVGNALQTIRDQRLYREEFKTFKDYCNEKWGMGKAHANRLIGGSRVAANLVSTWSTYAPLVKSSRLMKTKSAPLPSLSPHSSVRYGRKL